jgi:hypothetical protein
MIADCRLKRKYFGTDPPASPVRFALLGRRAGVAKHCGQVSRMARLFSCYCTKIKVPKFLLHTILRRGVDFAFDLDAFSEIDEKANLYTGGLEIIERKPKPRVLWTL